MSDEQEPVALEVLGDDVVLIDHGDQKYEMPATIEDADEGVLGALEAMKASQALEILMGPAQWRKYKSTKPKVRDTKELIKKYFVAIGMPEMVGE